MSEPIDQFIYVVASHTREGRPSGGIVGLFENKEDAIRQITEHQSVHNVYELYYRFISLEKWHRNVFQHPCVALGKAREEIDWFEWKMDEAVSEADTPDTGSYVACGCPEWAQGIFGFS